MVVIQTAKEELLTNNCIALGNVCFVRTIINKVFNGLVYFYKCGVMNVKRHEFIVEPECTNGNLAFRSFVTVIPMGNRRNSGCSDWLHGQGSFL